MTGKRFRALGLMSGTSMDGIDAALIETDGERVFALGPARTDAYDEAFRARLRAALGAERDDPDLAREIVEQRVARAGVEREQGVFADPRAGPGANTKPRNVGDAAQV